MLLGLAIRDIVLIDRLELAFAPGLSVLTGETGAGKSILLDALGLALGARADAGLLRRGCRPGQRDRRIRSAPAPSRRAPFSPSRASRSKAIFCSAGRSAPTAAAAPSSTTSPWASACCARSATGWWRSSASSSSMACWIPRPMARCWTPMAATIRAGVAAAWRAWQEASAARAAAEAEIEAARRDEEYPAPCRRGAGRDQARARRGSGPGRAAQPDDASRQARSRRWRRRWRISAASAAARPC